MVIYLHGLNSSGYSQKARRLRRGLAPMPVLAPDYPAHRPAEAVAHLLGWFARLPSVGDRDLVLVGSSMGGFYGQYLARRLPVTRLYLVNPALAPWDLLPPFLGQAMTTAQGETYVVNPDMIEGTRAFRVADPCDGVPTTVFLDAGDELIDAGIAARSYRDCGDVRLYPGGDHAFRHMDEVVALMLQTIRLRTAREPAR